eukprot:Sdes_comp23156_c0_seq1m21459
MDALRMDISSDNDNFCLLRNGIDLAIRQQEAVVKQVQNLLSKKAIVASGPFRYAYLEDSPDHHYFVQPLNLSKLALFLVDTLRECGRPSKPFVLASPNSVTGSDLVVGVAGARFGEVKKN